MFFYVELRIVNGEKTLLTESSDWLCKEHIDCSKQCLTNCCISMHVHVSMETTSLQFTVKAPSLLHLTKHCLGWLWIWIWIWIKIWGL